MVDNPGMLLWLWIIIAPALFIAFSGGLGGDHSSTHTNDMRSDMRPDNQRRM